MKQVKINFFLIWAATTLAAVSAERSVFCAKCDDIPQCMNIPMLPCEDAKACFPFELQICEAAFKSNECIIPGNYPTDNNTAYGKCKINDITNEMEYTLTYCPDRKYFSPVLMRCLDPEEEAHMDGYSRFANSPQFHCLCPGLFPHENDCKGYFDCSNGVKLAEEATCPNTTFFDEWQSTCSETLTSECAEQQSDYIRRLQSVADAAFTSLQQFIYNMQSPE